ncbi:hypothetical protein [Schaalia sp. lx-100]|uniref:hypothetical protein n=1 Tax=Schaalia sp. lx-100 TaxID=2899081 RepID=UPI001E61748B|nr:hypothetical protein [Schaalia sp. lx-100]MCD4557006.1 hypothetical protein [Schaalia sp. lx-100]
MGTPKSQPKNRSYTSRCKTDSLGHKHWQIYLPSKRGHAWVQLYDLPTDAQFRRMIFDEEYLPEWKLAYLAEQYAMFRERENARKHATKDGGREHDLDDPSTFRPSARRRLAQQLDPADNASPETLLMRGEQIDQAREQVEVVLSVVSPRHREWVWLSLGEQLSYVDIARAEHPDASKAEIDRYSNTIGTAINRAIKKIRDRFPGGCPVQELEEDV